MLFENELAAVLHKLGEDGITAFYIWLALEYASLFILLGLCSWGARSVWKAWWKWFKKNG